jgi:hypothetical protein
MHVNFSCPAFSEVRGARRAEDRAMLFLRSNSSHPHLLLAAAVHEVVLISKVVVPTFTAIELDSGSDEDKDPPAAP